MEITLGAAMRYVWAPAGAGGKHLHIHFLQGLVQQVRLGAAFGLLPRSVFTLVGHLWHRLYGVGLLSIIFLLPLWRARDN